MNDVFGDFRTFATTAKMQRLYHGTLPENRFLLWEIFHLCLIWFRFYYFRKYSITVPAVSEEKRTFDLGINAIHGKTGKTPKKFSPHHLNTWRLRVHSFGTILAILIPV